MLRVLSSLRKSGSQLRSGNECTFLNSKRQQIKTTRCSSQLYPITSRRWDDAMLQAETIVGSSSNLSNLQEWMSGEFNNITKYLQKLIGTNHPMLETAKRCAYISEGRMGGAQARGLTVILTAKAVENLSRHTNDNVGGSANQLLKNQLSLAEMTEMTYSAYMIHRGVMDLKLHGLEQVTSVKNIDESTQYAKGIHYGNKVSVLCGDFLLAYVMRGLGDLFSSKAVDLVASAITDFMEGEFLLIDDWRSKNYLLSEQSRDLTRWQRRSYSSIGSLQGNTCQAALVLGGIEGKLQKDANAFGKNLGMAWQAHTELQPFLNQVYEPIELPEMPPYPSFDLNCLPVMLFLRESYNAKRNFRLMLDEVKGDKMMEIDVMNQHRHQESVNYEKLHKLILEQDYAIQETYKIIRQYSQKAMSHLESFPNNEAKDILLNICESLYKK